MRYDAPRSIGTLDFSLEIMNQTTLNTNQTITYPLQPKGYIHHWLVAGPQAIPVTDLARFDPRNLKPAIAAAYHQPNHPITQSPAELAPLTVTDSHGEAELTWRAVRCGDDHFVDCTTFYHTCHYLRTWAYTELAATTAHAVALVLTANGPADVWLNGELVHQQQHFHHQLPQPVAFTAQLQAGQNTILICFTNVAIRECPYALALQVVGVDPAALTVHLPTTLKANRRQKLEQLFDAAYLDKDLYHREDEIIIRWPQDLPLADEIGVRLQTPGGRIYAEGKPMVKGGTVVNLGKAYQRPEGAYWVTLMPTGEEYYVHGMKIVRHLPLHIANGKFAETTYGAYAERRLEALTDAAHRTDNVYSEIAKMALGQWNKLKQDQFVQTIAQINQRADCSDFYLVGLLGALLRYGDNPAFPVDLKRDSEQCVLNFKYWMDEPGEDAMCYWSENHQILFHTCQVLAGQRFPDQLFTNSNQPGRWHQAKGEERAFSWLRKRAQGGFREWDSNVYFEHDILALSHLADLAENVELAEMAAVVLDKLCFTMALNSFKGVFGSTHGRTYAPYIKSGRLELTSGVGRLLWGVGSFNEHILGSVSLACAQSYELPPPIVEIGATPVEELWSREHHAGLMEAWCDLADEPWEVHKVTYKTPDYMLCSAQDYRAGQPGYQQHIWQATFSPDAVVFVTHPPCVSQDGSHRPNFWHGNVRLPRVAQWKDVLVALYNLPADDWLGFTHAYFPTACFDEYVMREGWAFARKGEGYLALTASGGVDLVTTGDNAYRELRSYAFQNSWLCHIGRTAVDGSFVDFQSKVLALDITFEPLALHATTLRGESLDFGWEGPLLVNELEQPLRDFPHYDSPFSVTELGAEVMEIRAWRQAMQLDFRPHATDDVA